MNVEDIILCEMSHSLKTNYVRFQLYEVPRVVKCIKTKSIMMVAEKWDVRRMESYCLMGTEI